MQMLTRVLLIGFLLLELSNTGFSQKIWEKGNTVIKNPVNNWVDGVKNIKVYLIEKKCDTIVYSEETYSEAGDRLSFTKYKENNSKDTLLSYNYNYTGKKLIEIKSKREWKKYHYRGENINSIDLWTYNKDTSYIEYFYNNENELIQAVSSGLKGKKTLYYTYNSQHQLLSRSLDNDIIFMAYEYDSKGNLTKEMNPKNVIKRSYKYDVRNNLIETRIHNDPFEIDSKRTYKYNDTNQLVKWTQYTGENKVFKIIKYDYDPTGKKTFVYYKRVKKKPDVIYIEKYEYW
jgi:YD repeat-containing protein